MHPHGVDVFDEADGDHLVFGIPHHFQFQFFPAQDRFFDQDLSDQRLAERPRLAMVRNSSRL